MKPIPSRSPGRDDFFDCREIGGESDGNQMGISGEPMACERSKNGNFDNFLSLSGGRFVIFCACFLESDVI